MSQSQTSVTGFCDFARKAVCSLADGGVHGILLAGFAMGFDLGELVASAGLLGVAAIVFAESGLLIGFFLPGDSLLFTAGILASQGFFAITPLVLLTIAAAIIGDSVGYSFGARVGRRLFQREESRFFHRKNLERAEAFYERHGKLTIILARFTPIVRTFAPIVAGIGKMRYTTFLAYNVIGGILWGAGITLLGYFLGEAIPDIDRAIIPIVVVIVVLSVIPAIRHALEARKQR